MRMERSFHCCSAGVIPNKMDICCPPGNKIATIKQNFPLLSPSYDIVDGNGKLIMKVTSKGSFFSCIGCCSDAEFTVKLAGSKTDAGKSISAGTAYLCMSLCCSQKIFYGNLETYFFHAKNATRGNSIIRCSCDIHGHRK